MFTIYFSATAIRHLFKGGTYLKVAFNSFTIIYSRVISYLVSSYVSFPANTMTYNGEFVFISCFIVQVFLVARHRRAAKAQKRRYYLCNVILYMHIAIFIMNIFICGSYSRAATISANSQSL